MNVVCSHGLPYNPQGQGIIERAHRMLKECLSKQKGGIGKNKQPKDRLLLTLFTLNFLNLDNNNNSAADRHQWRDGKEKGYVKWKDLLTGQWNGPDPVLVWARGSVCVFPQNRTDPVWVPERLTRKCNKTSQDEDSPADAAVADPESGNTNPDGSAMGDTVGVPETNASSP